MHRVRLVLPYLKEQGIRAEVLAVEAEQVAVPMDEWLAAGLPADLPVHRVKALGLFWSRIPGLGSISFRAMRALRRQGDALLKSGHVDLVYFSTTQFGVHVLGPRWKAKFGVPFVMDYQDPWVNDYYRQHPEQKPPGGRFKYAVMDWIHRRMEPAVLKKCAGITAVSMAYPEALARRYDWAQELPFLVQPFPGDARDIERAKQENIQQFIFTLDDGNIHWVYAGVIIPGMQVSLRPFFRALKDFAPISLLDKLRIHFVGTQYGVQQKANSIVCSIAKEYGLANLVDEHARRIPYSQVLACLRDANALLAFGSDDVGYTASKIYPYLLARKPLLAVFHESCSVVSLIHQTGGATCISFDLETSEDLVAKQIGDSWIQNNSYKQIQVLNSDAFAPYTARCSAEKMIAFFRRIVQKTPSLLILSILLNICD